MTQSDPLQFGTTDHNVKRLLDSRSAKTGEQMCVALLYETDILESLCKDPGLHRERAKEDAPTIRHRRRPNLTLSSLR